MSLTQHSEAVLEGFGAPTFPAACVTLRELLDRSSHACGLWLEAVAEKVPGFRKRFHAKTSDGYDWFWGFQFHSGSGRMCVLFPWTQDWEAHGGTKADRAIAVHLDGMTEPDVNAILTQLVAATRQEIETEEARRAESQALM